MDIKKLKVEFERSECFKRLEHVAQYTFFEFGAYIKRTDVPADIEKKCGKLITALLFSWSAWKEAKAQAVPDLGELQERIAGHQYYHDERGHMIVGMDDVVKEISSFDSCKAQAVPEGFVLIKDDTKTVVAIERMVEQQVEASGMDSHRLERLDGWRIIEAAVKAQEPTND
ncbi:MAG TPA: hypothetical protein K8V79_12765 [Acinetobacter lwoffii]|uniref:Uncharacterized protein n=1 Tax=Acinetobacter lwoffii TaxID=28090 RepID=A0A9D2UUU8_ACILW|nr:hypothetical protein [Acinetobacter lwoffii]